MTQITLLSVVTIVYIGHTNNMSLYKVCICIAILVNTLCSYRSYETDNFGHINEEVGTAYGDTESKGLVREETVEDGFVDKFLIRL